MKTNIENLFTCRGVALTRSRILPTLVFNLTPPVVISGQNVVSNPISGAQQFYRLIQ